MEGFCERVIAIAGSLVERNPSRTDLLVVKSAVEVFAAFQMKLYGLALEEGPGGPLFSEGTRLMAKGAGNLIKVERTHGAEYPQVYKFLAVALADAGDHNGVFEATRKGARYLAGDGQLYSGITFISFENSIFGIDARTACENLTQSAALLGEIIARHDGAAQRVLLAKMLYYLADSSVEGRQSEPAPEREKLKADAAENLEHVLKKDPGDFDALYTLGLIRLRALDARAALSCLERALAVKEEDKDLHYGLAVAYLLSGEKGKAVDQMRIFAGR
jgi:tetratricopeptide (TPR) repeat protein